MPFDINDASCSDNSGGRGRVSEREWLENVYTCKEGLTALYYLAHTILECLLSRTCPYVITLDSQQQLHQLSRMVIIILKDLTEVSRLVQRVTPGSRSRSFDLNSNAFSLRQLR